MNHRDPPDVQHARPPGDGVLLVPAPEQVTRRMPLGPPDWWDNYTSPCSDPRDDLLRASNLLGHPLSLVAMSRPAMLILRHHPLIEHLYAESFTRTHAPQPIPPMDLRGLERALGATPDIGPILPGSVVVDARMGADVLVGRSPDPEHCLLIVGALDAMRTNDYGLLPTVGR